MGAKKQNKQININKQTSPILSPFLFLAKDAIIFCSFFMHFFSTLKNCPIFPCRNDEEKTCSNLLKHVKTCRNVSKHVKNCFFILAHTYQQKIIFALSFQSIFFLIENKKTKHRKRLYQLLENEMYKKMKRIFFYHYYYHNS